MYKARIGKFYDELKTSTNIEYLMSPDVHESYVLKVNDSFMIDIDNHNFYPIVKRNERGYLESDIELNKEYVISYENVKKNDYEIYKKCAIAKIYALTFNHYQKELERISKKEEKTKKLVK